MRRGWVPAVAGAGLLPWLGVLAATLPDTYAAQHWRLAWLGLDVLELVGLLLTGWWLLRHDRRAPLVAAATAAVLLVDAWFDVTTAGPDVGESVAMALVELPLAAFCLFSAFAVQREPHVLPRP
ncbi:hypothetical protein VSH64_31930 [Amycolatopsis rhabdoformis]|uniref:LPXTG cell wall anchor domain-containing protein n=1 Tax=Amycolatopsis rhabdoformis TaxID=1448059 RepID=A0ABZ1I0Y4_9PSEU|nr:hypothetical protein [Amycolatopsis rhabdoformis]WSE27452.1 hypothetical protein VSH64_31930 [Amycolatopsis rhabdoformis]